METINAEKTNLTQMFVFFATFFSLFQFLLQYMPRKHQWFYNLPVTLQIGTVIRLMSSFHALLATCLSLFVLYTDVGLQQNKLMYSSFGISFTLNLSIGFLAYDCLIMFIHRNEFELGYGVHHFVSIVAFYACSTAGIFPYIALFRLVSEASTIFINNRWILLTLKMKDSKMYFWNGVAVVLVFAAVRILTIVPNWRIFFSLMETPQWNSVDTKHILICVCSTVPLDILNLFWFTKIVRIIYKMLFNKSNSQQSVSSAKKESDALMKKLLDSEHLKSTSLIHKNE